MTILIIAIVVLAIISVYYWYNAEKWKSHYEFSQCELRTTESILKDSQLSINKSLMTNADEYVKTLDLLKDTHESLAKLWGCIQDLIDKLEETDKSHSKTSLAMMETIKELAQTIDLSDNRTKALIELTKTGLPKKSGAKKKTSSDKNITPEENILNA